jgi:gold/copper resistance efflux system membrane fusion protein
LTVAATDTLSVTFNVSESLYLQFRRDGRAEPGVLAAAVGFAGEAGYPHAAAVDLAGPVVDARTGTVRCRATVPNPNGLLLPGMTARVRLAPK